MSLATGSSGVDFGLFMGYTRSIPSVCNEEEPLAVSPIFPKKNKKE